MKVLITGATGFVGSHLTDLLTEQGHEVFSLVRNPNKAKEFETKGTLVEGSLNPIKRHDWISELPVDLDAVVHSAGIVHSVDSKEFFRVNSESTRQLVEDLSHKYKNLKFILISSLAASGPCSNSEDETKVPTPVSDYGRSKLIAESILQKEAPEDWKKVIIRPPMVIGPRDPAILDVFKMVKKGFVPSIGFKGGRKKYSFIGIFDLIETIRLSLEKELKGTEIFFSAHPETVRFEKLLSVIAKKMQKKSPFIVPIPLSGVKLATGFISLAKIKDTRLTPDKVHEIVPKAWTCSGKKAETKLGQNYKWNLDSIIEATLKDYKQRGWL